MKPEKTSLLCFALLISIPIGHAQQAREWLTTSSRSAILAEQTTPISFTDAAPNLPVIEVNDMQQNQSMEGFGFALTGGSAQLLMRMTPERRQALLEELFAPTGDGIHVSYLRVSIGSSDMNDHAYTYDDLPAGETDPELKKFIARDGSRGCDPYS